MFKSCSGSIILITILIILCLSGYGIAYYQWTQYTKLQQIHAKDIRTNINEVIDSIAIIDDRERALLDDIGQSKARVDSLINQFNSTNKSGLTIDSALKIIEGI